MKVIISGGGTGGHLYPAIAIADVLKRQNPACEILFIGANGKMEMYQVPAAGYPILGLPIRSIERKFRHMLKNMVLPFRLLISLWKAKRILKEFKPDIVVGTGGYASFPAVYMAAQMRVPTVLQEQNAYPGIANKLLAKYANKICVAYENMATYFPEEKIVLTGNPVREFLTKIPESYLASYAYFGLTPGVPTVLVLGGSQGAAVISDYILKASKDFLQNTLQVILSTGKAYFEKINKEATHMPHFKILPYIERMDLALATANIVVSRAGAIAIAEIGAAQKPAIFIPSPNVVADHQMKNILPLVAKDAAILVKEHEVPEKLIKTIIELAKDEQRQRTLVENLRKYSKPHAAAAIAEVMKKLL